MTTVLKHSHILAAHRLKLARVPEERIAPALSQATGLTLAQAKRAVALSKEIHTKALASGRTFEQMHALSRQTRGVAMQRKAVR
jgi:hypothetical protein